MSPKTYLLWAILLIIQNFAFTFVSRARNSGSLKRHMLAAFFSNGVWFLSQIIIIGQVVDILTGKYGLGKAIFTGLAYTGFTMAGSLVAHYVSLVTEKGKTAVGATKKYAQITPEDWARVTKLAEQAYDVSVGALPTSATAKKVDGAVVTTGV